MNQIDFIARHLNHDLLPELHNCDTVCAFSGKHITQGILKKSALSSNFTDFEFIKYDSDYISPETWLCISSVLPGKSRLNSLRSYSYLVTINELKLLEHPDLMPIILNPPAPPFIFVITENHKKHTAYKSIINHSTDSFMVTTDTSGNVCFNKAQIEIVYPVMQKWYSIIPGKENTELKPTWFNKDEILKGCTNFNKIKEYGHNAYFNEDNILESYRNTTFFNLLVFCLQKADRKIIL